MLPPLVADVNIAVPVVQFLRALGHRHELLSINRGGFGYVTQRR